MRIWIAAGAMALSLAGVARADVAEEWDTGFTTRNSVEVKATREQAWARLGEIGRWWNPAHTYSGDAAANLKIEMKPGGCFCETLPGGGVRHGVVAMVWPAQGLLRIDAALGPLQDKGVSGVLTFQIRPKGDGVEIVQVYTVGGGKPGFAKAMAAPVDGVVGEQLRRFKAYVETGKPT